MDFRIKYFANTIRPIEVDFFLGITVLNHKLN